ncbi:sulfite exporter TauE/SafE family protein [Longitalea arenae]|uniref:sulfite exporter TauE/SafE family protein n=1 Tax=Longitalea arenae TaxID=2812558 RepID=UPI001967FE3E|nr:sulfite exporter TauE/SafE family protein [Longitalea arenae]
MELSFYGLLFIVAFLYASVGHGGASGYLALMALFGIAPEVMKPTALMLNLFVSLTSFIQFYRGKHFKWQIFLPFAIASIPMAYLGGLIHIDGDIYKKILGLLLLIPVIRFWFFSNLDVTGFRPANGMLSLVIGGTIGFISGLIGIGGGIILSPILLMLKWTDQKQTAAISALFIFVNSIAGLLGQLQKGIHFSADMYWYVAVAFIGGLAGAYFGALRFKQAVLKNILASALLVASIKLIFAATDKKPADKNMQAPARVSNTAN